MSRPFSRLNNKAFTWCLLHAGFLLGKIRVNLKALSTGNTGNYENAERVGAAVTLLTCNREVIGLNLGRDIYYSKVFRRFPQSLKRKFQNSTFKIFLPVIVLGTELG
jgi:hypothetical protein